MLRIADYLRLSKEDAFERDESNSITNQRLLISSYIENNPELANADLIEYCDDGYSGTNDRRPAFQRLLNDVKCGKIDCIIVKDFSRFMRDYIDIGNYINKIFPFLHVRFIAILDRYDSARPGCKTLSLDNEFKTLVDDLYAKDTSQKIKNNNKILLEKGMYIFGNVPLGYRRCTDNHTQVEIDEFEGKIFRYIVDLAKEEISSYEIAYIFTEEKIPTYARLRGRKPRNEKTIDVWNGSYISTVLRNPFYVGDFIYGKSFRPVPGGKNILLPREQWKIIPNHHPALMSREELEYFTTRNEPKIPAPRNYDKGPLVGRVFCGNCGRRLTFVIGKNGQISCTCPNAWQQKNEKCCKAIKLYMIEEVLLYRLNMEIRKCAEKSEIRLRWNQEFQSDYQARQQKHESLVMEKNHLDREFEETYRRYAEGNVSIDQFKTAKKKLTNALDSIAEKIRMNEQYLEEVKYVHFDSNTGMSDLLSGIETTQISQKLVDVFVDKIVMYHDQRLEIKWKFQSSNLSAV